MQFKSTSIGFRFLQGIIVFILYFFFNPSVNAAYPIPIPANSVATVSGVAPIAFANAIGQNPYAPNPCSCICQRGCNSTPCPVMRTYQKQYMSESCVKIITPSHHDYKCENIKTSEHPIRKLKKFRHHRHHHHRHRHH